MAATSTAGIDPSRITELANQFRGLGQNQQRMLDVIDSLRSASLDQVKLPQLVVVGDQSAGKSSVLDAISGIPIPKDPDGCTRFATEYRLRRGKEYISISIIPSKNRPVDDVNRLARLNRRLTDKAELGDLIKECEDEIFGGYSQRGRRRFVSRDILTIEISGPTMPLLTLVDLPGFIHAPNNKQTAEDRDAINEIAQDYMSRPRTIILAVVGGSSDYATQVVLSKALSCDTGGTRTLGIVTKPDLTNNIGLEDKFLRLVNNGDIKLDLGWHVLRNRTPQETDASADIRNQKERDFFAEGKWSTLPSGATGVEDLVTKLSLLLYRHIAKHSPQLLDDIRQELEGSEEALRALGRPISTDQEMKTELATLFSDSKKLIESGINGEYNDSDHREFFPLVNSGKEISPRNFRARAVLENMEFERRIRIQGHKFEFHSGGKSDGTGEALSAGSRAPVATTREEYVTKTVEPLLRQGAGRQLLDDHNPLLVYDLFRDYSSNWVSIAREHKDKMESIANEFLHQVVDFVWPERMRSQLWSALLDEQIRIRSADANEELERLFQDRRRYVPVYGPDYQIELKALQDKSSSSPHSAAKQLLEKMLAYYKLTCKTFITNVIVQVIERHIIDGLNDIFHTRRLITMKEDTVADIAAEDDVTKSERDRLGKKVACLRKAHNDCLGIVMENQRTNRKPIQEVTDTSSDEENSRKASRRKSRRIESTTERHNPRPASSSVTDVETTTPPVTPPKQRKRKPDHARRRAPAPGPGQARAAGLEAGAKSAGQDSEPRAGGLMRTPDYLAEKMMALFSDGEEFPEDDGLGYGI